MKKDLEIFHTYLSSRRLKVTKTRKLIIEEIFSAKKIHPNAYEIHQRLKKKGYKVSLASIYRTLNLLVKSGLVSEIDLGEDHSHYEPDITETGHGHLVCLSCGRVKEFSHGDIRKIISKIGKEKHFKMDKFSIQVFGYCNSCQKK
jgi:Fur family ferric uptake transcriptional regulator